MNQVIAMPVIEGFDQINIPRRPSKHGGLIIYVKNIFYNLVFDLIPESEVFENLFIKVQHKQNLFLKYVTGNVYHPSHDIT